MRIALIPARGGSKRIPHKNIKDFCGRPILAYSIEAAQKSGLFEAIVVSTDDERIAAIAKHLGARVPFLRPAHLSDDSTGTLPVIAHAAERLELGSDDLLCCLYPTAPLLESSSLILGLEALGGEVSYTFGAVHYDYPPQRSFMLKENGAPTMLFPEHFQSRSQDLNPIFHDAGQFYWARAETWRAQEPIFTPSARAIVLDPLRVQDIDTLEDWKLAEMKYRLLESS